MKKTNSRLIAVLLVAAMALSVLVACGQPADSGDENTPGDGETTPAAAADTTPAETTENPYDENGYLKDEIPEDINFNNQVINVLYWNNAKNVEYTAEDDGNIINSAIFNRNIAVEDRLGVTFTWIGEKGDYGQRADFNKIIAADLSGACEYDIISAYSTTIAMAATYGYALDLLQYNEQLKLDKPWWGADLTNMATINDKLYFATGDISTNYLLRMYGTFFNKQLIDQNGLTSPYDYVDKNEWTVDKFIELGSAFKGDPNGNAPIYGFVNDAITVEALFYGSDLRFVDKDTNDVPYLSDSWSGERAQSLIDKMSAYCITPSVLIDSKNDEVLFTEGSSLFIIYSLDLAMNHLASSNVDFGIVPIPKYDSQQQNYSTTLNYKYSLYMISKGSDIPDIAAYALEALASEGYRRVTPDLYEQAMKVRYVTDTTSQKMIDYIRDGVSFEIGRTFTHSFEYQTYRTIRAAIAGTAEQGWQSTVASFNKVLGKQLENLVASLNQE